MSWNKLHALRATVHAIFAIRDRIEQSLPALEIRYGELQDRYNDLHARYGDLIGVVERLSSVVATRSELDALKAEVTAMDRHLAGNSASLERLTASNRVVGNALGSVTGAVADLHGRVGRLTGEGPAELMAVAGQPAETQYYQALNSVGILNYQNDWVSGEHRFLARLLEWRPDAVVFDVGAHSGDYTRLVRSLSEQARIFAFEPHPVTFETLARVAEETGARAVPVGLGDQSHALEIYDYADSDGSQHASLYRDVIERIHKKPATSHTIRIEPLDSMATDLEVERIDLLKVDTEGHELAVFQGATRLFAERRIDVIQFEFNEMNVMSRTFFRDFMEALADFRLFRLLPDGVIPLDDYRPTFLEIFAFQNIVAVRRDLDPAWLMGAAR